MIEASYIFMAVLLPGCLAWAVTRWVIDWRAQAWRRTLHRESKGSWKPNERNRRG